MGCVGYEAKRRSAFWAIKYSPYLQHVSIHRLTYVELWAYGIDGLDGLSRSKIDGLWTVAVELSPAGPLGSHVNFAGVQAGQNYSVIGETVKSSVSPDPDT